jgi:16S rRNA processing protein RimM
LRLTGIDTPEKAEALIDHAVYGEPGTVAASDERYAIGDLEGCSVVLEDGSHLGTITDVWLMPANDVWIVTQPDGHTIPLPVIDPVILNVDMAQRIITVHLLDGLADINRPSSEESDA